MILGALPPLTAEEQREGLLRAIGVLLSQGITSYTDPGLTPEEIDVYRDAADNGALSSRVALMLSSSRSLGVGGTGGGSLDLLSAALERYPRPEVFAPRMLELRGVKILADGIPPNLTGWLYEPYLIGGGVGGLVLEGEDDAERVAQMRSIVRRAHSAGFHVGTHATGDRTCDVVTTATWTRSGAGGGLATPGTTPSTPTSSSTTRCRGWPGTGWGPT